MSEKKWRVSGTVVGGTYIGHYEAENGDEAIDKGIEDAHISFCHQCSDNCEDPQILAMVAEREVAPSQWETVERDMGLETPWEAKARAAGWRPPAKPRKARSGR